MNEIQQSEQDSLCGIGSHSQRQVTLPLHLIINDDKDDNKYTERQEDTQSKQNIYLRTNSDTARKVRLTPRNLTPKADKSFGSFSQIFNFESENGLGRRSQGTIGISKSRRQKGIHQKQQKTIQVEEEPLQMHNQQVMRKTYNKIRLQVLAKQFVDKMLSLLKRNEIMAFQCHKEFYNILNDKAAFFDHQNEHIQDMISHANIDKKIDNSLKKSVLNKSQLNLQKQSYLPFFWDQLRFLAKLVSKIPVISIFSKQKLVWDQLQLLCLGFFFIIIPLVAVFNIPIEEIIRTNAIHIIFIILMSIDILINFNTSLFQQGRETKDHLKIAQYYFSNGFITDITTLICIIIYIILEDLRSNETIEVFTDILLLIFYLRFQQFGRVLKKIEIQYHFSPQISQALRLINLLFMNIYIIHVLSCFWIQVALWENNAATWLVKFNLRGEVWYLQFLNSFYFNTVTMVTVGYGDISPQTDFERLFSVLTVLSACCVFAYSISEVGSIFQEMNKSTKKRNNQMFIINNYMKKKKITSDLQYQIRHYLEYYWNESISENNNKEKQIINQLSNNLKENLMVEANRLLLESPFFRNNFSVRTILKTVSIVTEQRCTPEEIIFLEGDRDDQSIYFIEKGSVQIFHTFGSPSLIQSSQISVRKQGEYFGEIGFFTGSQRRHNYRSLEFTTLIKIERSKFLEILQESPEDFERFCLIKDDLAFNNNQDHTQRKCTFCRDQGLINPSHIESQCPVLHFIPNKQRDSFRYSFIEEKRSPFSRFVQQKYRALLRIEQTTGDQHRINFTQEGLIQNYIQTNGLFYMNDDEEEEEDEEEEYTNEEIKSQTSSSDNSQNSNQTSSSNSDENSHSRTNESNTSEKNHPPNSSKNISPLVFKSKTPKKSFELPSIDKRKGKTSVIQEVEQENEQDISPIKKRNTLKKNFQQYYEDQFNKDSLKVDVEDFQISSFHDESDSDQNKDYSRQSSLIMVNQVFPFETNAMNRVIQRPSLVHSKSQTNQTEQNNPNMLTSGEPIKRKQSLFRSKSHENTELVKNRSKQGSFSSRKSSLQNQQKDVAELSKQNSSKKTKSSMYQSVKFQLPKKNYKHRNSKSLQEISQERDQIKLIVQRYKSEKNIDSHNNSFTSSKPKRQIGTSINNSPMNTNNINNMKWLLQLKKSISNLQNQNKDIYGDGESKRNSKENQKLQNELGTAYNNLFNQNMDNQRRFSQQLESLVDNFKAIQEMLINKQHDSHHHHEQLKYFTKEKPLQNPIFSQFEQMKSYQIYFPHNNYENVLNQIQQKSFPNKQKKYYFKNSNVQNWLNKNNQALNLSSPSLQLQSNEQNNAAITDIFGQNSINRLKILRSTTNIRKASMSDQLLFGQNQQNIRQKITNDGKDPSPQNKKSGSATFDDESNKVKTPQQRNSNKLESDIDHRMHQYLIPNYFGVNADTQPVQVQQQQRSKFAIKSSNFSKIAIEHESDVSQIESKDVVSNYQN